MPTYDYNCESCNYREEVLSGFKAQKKKICPECKQPTLIRQIGTGAGIIFKGSGFYETDVKQKEERKRNKEN